MGSEMCIRDRPRPLPITLKLDNRLLIRPLACIRIPATVELNPHPFPLRVRVRGRVLEPLICRVQPAAVRRLVVARDRHRARQRVRVFHRVVDRFDAAYCRGAYVSTMILCLNHLCRSRFSHWLHARLVPNDESLTPRPSQTLLLLGHALDARQILAYIQCKRKIRDRRRLVARPVHRVRPAQLFEVVPVLVDDEVGAVKGYGRDGGGQGEECDRCCCCCRC